MHKNRALLTATGLLVFAGIALADGPTRFAADRPVDCTHIKLDLKVDLSAKHVDGVATISVTALRDVGTITLDGVDLTTEEVAVSRQGGSFSDVAYTNDGEHIEIELAKPLATGQDAKIRIKYAVDNPRDGLNFFGPSKDEPDVANVVWSQGESITNRFWFPCFDNPNEKQTTEMIVTAKAGYEASSNGRLISKKENPSEGTVTFHYLQDKPHAAYLVTLIVGEFYIKHDTWRGKPISYWVHPRFKEQVDRSFGRTKAMLDFFSDKIGIDYPWDRYGQVCCDGFGGGMENTSVTTMGNRALHDERSFLDANSDDLIAHEMAHQWWGDMLTCRDWAHIWLNEGFASYFEALWAEHADGDNEFRYNMFRKAKRAMRGGKKRPIVDRSYDHPRSMFDARAYPKGAWALHMMRKRLGDDLFWKVINRYGTDNKFKTVETVDLRKAAETVTGQSFERFFYDWTERPGNPELKIGFKWLNDEKLAKVSVDQKQDDDAFHFPLTLEFHFDGDRSPVVVSREIESKNESFYFPLPGKPELFRVDPGYTLLGDIQEKKGRDLWSAQLVKDADPIARIRAAAHFGERSSDSDRKLLAKALESEAFWGVQAEIAKALAKIGGDIARDALIDGLKFENHKARRACADELGSFHKDDVAIAALRRIVEHGDPSYRVEAAAITSFAELQSDEAFEVLAKVLTRDSRSEVLRSAALRGLGDLRDPRVVPVLAEWTKSDRPRLARPAAIGALARVTKRMHVDDDVTQLIVDTLEACLGDTGRRVRGAAVRALGGLGDPSKARSALASLEFVVANDPEQRVQSAAKRAIKAIETGTPAQVQLAELRSDLKEALETNEDLVDRIQKLEALVEHPAPQKSKAEKVAVSARHTSRKAH